MSIVPAQSRRFWHGPWKYFEWGLNRPTCCGCGARGGPFKQWTLRQFSASTEDEGASELFSAGRMSPVYNNNFPSFKGVRDEGGCGGQCEKELLVTCGELPS